MTRRKTVVQVSILVLVFVAFAVIETQVGMPSSGNLRGYFDGFGWIALPAFALFYVVATLLPLPKAVVTIAGGAIFGYWIGLAAVLVGAIAGSVTAFSAARWLGRRSVRGVSADRVRRLDDRIGRHGFLTVVVARLIPIVPFTTINYVFGITAVTFRSYVIATAIGITPGTAIYVAVGAYGFSPGSWQFVIAVVGVIAFSIVGVVHSRQVRATEESTYGESGDAPSSTT